MLFDIVLQSAKDRELAEARQARFNEHKKRSVQERPERVQGSAPSTPVPKKKKTITVVILHAVAVYVFSPKMKAVH